MIWSIPRLQHSYELFPRVFKEVALWLIPLAFLLWGLESYVSFLHQQRFVNPYESSMVQLILAGLGAFLLESLIAVGSLILVAMSTRRQMKNGIGEPLIPSLKSHFHQTLIEYVRAMMSVGFYSLLLIVPGIIRWIQITFTCFVCLFNKSYALGSADALEKSSQLVKGRWLALFLLIAIQAFLPMALEELGKSLGFTGSEFIFQSLSWLFTLIFSIYLTLTYFALESLKMESV